MNVLGFGDRSKIRLHLIVNPSLIWMLQNDQYQILHCNIMNTNLYLNEQYHQKKEKERERERVRGEAFFATHGWN